MALVAVILRWSRLRVWALKHATRKDVILKRALEEIDMALWFRRYPFKRGDSPLSLCPEYEQYVFDQVENSAYSPFWKQIGLNTEEHIERFADVPVVFMSGWFDIYCRSTVDFYVALSRQIALRARRSPVQLIMGPWQHVGVQDHVAGEVDFGIQVIAPRYGRFVPIYLLALCHLSGVCEVKQPCYRSIYVRLLISMYAVARLFVLRQ